VVQTISDSRVTGSGCCGSARLLDGGNWLVQWGAADYMTELDPSGNQVMTINYKAPFFLIQAVADHIRDNGRIINVSTGFTRIAAPTHPAYAASKGALETLTLALAPEFAARGITVNAVLPGVTETDMNAEWLASPDARAGAEALSVFSRVGRAEDVADVIAFLASNDARWTTGQMIDATGGARI